MGSRRALLLAVPALLTGAGANAGRVLRPDPDRPPRANPSALLWLHPHFTEGPPPDPPPFADRLIDHGWDLWRLDRDAAEDPASEAARAFAAADPLGAGASLLAESCHTLRERGYRRIAILGESRGAFIALAALHMRLEADSLLLLAPAAHGQRVERKPQALTDFQTALAHCARGPLQRLGLVLFRDDPYDPDPAARAGAFTAITCAQTLLIDRPATPVGHGAARDPAFDRLFGARLAEFLAG